MVVSNKLEDIKGVGPKTLSLLKEANIRSIEQLSKLKVDELEHLDGIGATKAKQFIREAKKKLEESKINKNSETIELTAGINHSIIQQLHKNMDRINTSIDRLDERIEVLERNHNTSEGTEMKRGDINLFNQSSIIKELKQKLVKQLNDPAFFEKLFSNGIKTYFQEQQKLFQESQKRQSAKITHLKEQIKLLQQQISLLENEIHPKKLKETKKEEIIVEESDIEIDIIRETKQPLEPQKTNIRPANLTMNQELILEPHDSYERSIQDIRDIETYIKHLLEPGDSIQIDRLIKRKELQNISLTQLKKAIYTLIDKNVVAPAESSTSVQKIEGNIGKLTRIN
jgi:hypothetical protein